MNCERCRASHNTRYPEGGGYDWYCLIGWPEDCLVEFKDGHYGCTMHYKVVEKMVDKLEELIEQDHAAYVDFFLEGEKDAKQK